MRFLRGNVREALVFRPGPAAVKAFSLMSRGRSPSGFPLPPVHYRMGGVHFRTDAAFVAAGVADVERLVDRAGLTRESYLLDWGCGAGRLAIGIKEHLGQIATYHGVDVNRGFIAWDQHHLGGPRFRFSHVDTANERYNPGGVGPVRIPADTGTVDVFYAYSVFSHLRAADTGKYLQEIRRLLRPEGQAFVTAFVEDGVPDEDENPAGYGPLSWTAPLHCVRFNREFFDGLVAVAGLGITDFEHGTETDGQSLYLLRARH